MRMSRYAALFFAFVAVASADQAGEEFFETRIRPLLAKKCFVCHTETKMGGLRLDSREAVLKGGGRGHAVAPGKPGESLLFKAVSGALDELKMPPTEPLAKEQIADIRKWIADGAVWPETKAVASVAESSGEYVIRPEFRDFWSFQPVRKPPLPEVRDKNWTRTDVDRFILARLEKEGLRPVTPVEKRALIRRATLDLIGLPPTPEEVEAFLADDSPEAFAKVVDGLLGSPHYGERWGRYWLDLARYGEGMAAAYKDTPFPFAYRYRDWVINAFNGDMPYDQFIKAQLAADLMPDADEDSLPALGFHALGKRDDDRVDVTGRVFLGLTLGCAQCHDHKYDPIPTKDFYSMQGVFSSSEKHEYPLVDEKIVAAYKGAQQKVKDKKIEIDDFLKKVTDQLIDIAMTQTADYLFASWRVMRGGETAAAAATDTALDQETLERWITYLGKQGYDHQFLGEWKQVLSGDADEIEVKKRSEALETSLLAIHREKREVDDVNYVRLGGADGARDQKTLLNTNLDFLEPVKWYFWRDVAYRKYRRVAIEYPEGIYHRDAEGIKRFLNSAWLTHLERLEAEHEALEKAVPKQYAFIHTYRDAEEPEDIQVHIRGDKKNLGDLAPRRWLAILSPDEPQPFTDGSGRLQLAEAIASADNPLTARVMVNRVWQHHFGSGIVTSPSNYGRLGERPTHPELLDYLAATFVESGWSLKKLHREMMLSATYRQSSEIVKSNYEKDASNRFLWRFQPHSRMDAEVLRDSMLAVAGNLDGTAGGPSEELENDNHRRAIYGSVSRTTPNRMLTLFDFPDPKDTAPERSVTVGPLQRLFFLNNEFVIQQAEVFAKRLQAEAGENEKARVRRAYELLYSRSPTKREVKAARRFFGEGESDWVQYAQVLLASSEFTTVR
jgi:hypothetical protein